MDDRFADVRCVVFDAVGTLIEPLPRVADAYLQIGSRHGATLDRDEVRRRFHQAFAEQEQRDRDAGDWRTSDRREQQRWEQIVARVFAELSDTAALLEELWQHFARAEHWQVLPDGRQAVAQLQAAGYQVAVASNFDSRLFELRDGFQDELPCEHWFASSEVGYRKPAREFFAALETALGYSAQQLMLVGDDPHNDFDGARTAGWQALLIDRNAEETDEVLASLSTLAGHLAHG